MTQLERLIDIFTEQKECEYKGELYSVRDNGAVYRHTPLTHRKARPLDNVWTFGRKNQKNGYMTIGQHRVHIIVATAFHGVNDSTKLVVDHIDTNRCNNRPENLRWVTRLENALNNPVTRKRIEFLCGGDINRFIENPACLRDFAGLNQDIEWMRNVSVEEARNAYERVMRWSKEDSIRQSLGDKIGEWIYTAPSYSTQIASKDSDSSSIVSSNIDVQGPLYFDSLTLNAKQKSWKTPTEFPMCPKLDEERSLESYLSRIEVGGIVTKNKYFSCVVDEFGIYNNNL